MTSKEMVAELKVAAEVEVQKFADIMESIDLEMKASEDKGFDLGLKQAGIPATDKIYTEEDLQAEKAILQGQIDSLKAKVDGFDQLVADEKAQACAQLKASIVADLESVEVDNAALLEKLKVN